MIPGVIVNCVGTGIRSLGTLIFGIVLVGVAGAGEHAIVGAHDIARARTIAVQIVIIMLSGSQRIGVGNICELADEIVAVADGAITAGFGLDPVGIGSVSQTITAQRGAALGVANVGKPLERIGVTIGGDDRRATSLPQQPGVCGTRGNLIQRVVEVIGLHPAGGVFLSDGGGTVEIVESIDGGRVRLESTNYYGPLFNALQASGWIEGVDGALGLTQAGVADRAFGDAVELIVAESETGVLVQSRPNWVIRKRRIGCRIVW